MGACDHDRLHLLRFSSALNPFQLGKSLKGKLRKHWTINQVWPRLVQERFGSVGLCGGRDLAAEIASSENSRWVALGFPRLVLG